MTEVKLNNKVYNLDIDSGNSGKINSVEYSFEVLSEKNDNYIVKMNGKTFDIDVIEVDNNTKKIDLLINGTFQSFSIKNDFDILISKLGYNKTKTDHSKLIKAPMPGLVHAINVEVGDSIIENQKILILEAMKMENIIKSKASGIVKEIKVNVGDSVNKDEILVVLE